MMPPVSVYLCPAIEGHSMPSEERLEQASMELQKLSVSEVKTRFPLEKFPMRDWSALEYLSFDVEFLQQTKDVLQHVDSMKSLNEHLEFLPSETKSTLINIVSDIQIYKNPDCSEGVRILRNDIQVLSHKIFVEKTQYEVERDQKKFEETLRKPLEF
jgi:hypothetical protein